uniref:Signal recognition particle subunit SRP72 n=1 Tax=Aegilops tauschii subsp. strangulata TaxID=200361 RepID=A0A453G6Y9_AEGTS
SSPRRSRSPTKFSRRLRATRTRCDARLWRTSSPTRRTRRSRPSAPPSASPSISATTSQAYCYYRQNKLQEALDILNGQEETAAVLQLESQIYYRLGRMNDCMSSYEKLQKFKVDSIDLKINIIAALVAGGRASEVQVAMKAQKVDLTTRALRDTRSFELAYNSACTLIENKKYSEAKEQLDLAKRIGKEELMVEDYAEDEIEYELAPVSVQLAYVQQLQGQTQEAMETYANMINKKSGDPSSLAVATTNLISIKGTKDVADGLRKLDRLVEKSTAPNQLQLIESLEFKLSSRQKEALYSARVLLLLHANKIDQGTRVGQWAAWYVSRQCVSCFTSSCSSCERKEGPES